MIHTVLINSRNLYSGTITNGTYLIDWTLMPEKKYLLRWGFGGGIVNGTLINKVCLLHMDLGQSKTFVSDDTVVRSKNTQLVHSIFRLPRLINCRSTVIQFDH